MEGGIEMTESDWKKFWGKWQEKFIKVNRTSQAGVLWGLFKMGFCKRLLEEEKKAEKDVELLKEYMNKLTKNGKNPTHKIFVNLVEQGKRDGRRVFAIKMRKTIEEKK